jgi:methylmalonyl-CoA mutase N-terminal domain/subunit
MEQGAYDYFDAIDRLGGMVEAIEHGFPQREIGEASYRFQQEFEAGRKQIVGVNAYVETDEEPIPILYIDDSAHEKQMSRLEDLKKTRDNDRVAKSLDALRAAARGRDNTMYPLLECVRAYATVGEMCDALRDVWGEWEEEPLI